MAKIFWVEDHFHWVEKFRPILENTDFDGQPNTVEIHKFAEAAKQSIAQTPTNKRPDVAVLDARMNGNDQAGFSVSSALSKKWPGLPVIYLSEHSGTEIERDALVEHNAADFIAKHQRNVEDVLCWRIKAVLRQKVIQTGPSGSAPNDILCSGEFKMDLNTWEAYWQGNKLMNPDNPKRPLAPTPRKILRCLVERSPRPVTAEQISEYIGVAAERFSYASYRQHIKTLRRAFDAAAGDASFSQASKQDCGIVAFGDAGAYCWKLCGPVNTEETT